MTMPCYFLFGVHNHQPVGNFDFVFEEAFQRSYLPFVDVLERHPGIRVAMHFTGCLLDYLVPHHPEYIERLRGLGERGQVEFMTGGYYEPILPIIPHRDKVGQILKLSNTIEHLFGQRPVGMWLAERVWEPHLPAAMVEAGVRYCVLDDTHFRCSGLTEADGFGYYLTEENGAGIALFPILEKFRYTIPFADPEETIEYMRGFAAEADRPLLAVMADDGEKFGVWPQTYEHCYTNGWVERFFTAMEALSDEFPMIHFREALEQHEPRGKIYLPTASYFEMMEWAMPVEAIRRYEHAQDEIEQHELTQKVGAFFRGGFWRNFLVKYPESNLIHKKMIWISDRFDKALHRVADKEALVHAREFLWRGQCNCAYWHGVFGGLYLAHLRNALHRNLNIANRLLGEVEHGQGPWLQLERLDYEVEGHEALLIETDRWMLAVSPWHGGMILEADYKPRDLNLCDTLSRREEAYHHEVRDAVVETPGAAIAEQAESIHGAPKAKEAGLEKLLHYDAYRRLHGIDHFIDPGQSFEGWCDDEPWERGDFVDRPYALKRWESNGEAVIEMEREGEVLTARGAQRVAIHKALVIQPGHDDWRLRYRLTNCDGQPFEGRFGVEFNVNLLAGDAHDRYPFIEGQDVRDRRLIGREAQDGVTVFGLVDEWMQLRVGFELSQPATLWRSALETVSASEAGFERVYQGTTLLPHWVVRLDPGQSCTFEVRQFCRTDEWAGAG